MNAWMPINGSSDFPHDVWLDLRMANGTVRTGRWRARSGPRASKVTAFELDNGKEVGLYTPTHFRVLNQ